MRNVPVSFSGQRMHYGQRMLILPLPRFPLPVGVFKISKKLILRVDNVVKKSVSLY